MSLNGMTITRRSFGAFAVLSCAATAAHAAGAVQVRSPTGGVRFVVASERGRLVHAATLGGAPVVERSALGLEVDGVDLGDGVVLGAVERYRTDDTYPWRGVHATAVDRSQGARIAVRHVRSGTSYTVEVRAYDDAVAFRFIVPGAAGRRRVPDAATAFVLPSGSTVWYHG